MCNKKRKVVIWLTVFVLSVWCFSFDKKILAETEGDSKLKTSDEIHIVLDPGHGGDQAGAEIIYEETKFLEKDINLKIAKYLKEELLEYEGVKVSMTRTEDTGVELSERTEIAVKSNADVLISLHNNAKGECSPYTNGCTILTAKGDYKKELAEEEQKLACNILYELSELGIENQGILLRNSENKTLYPDNSLADYYAIIRNGVNADLQSILIEHVFMDDEHDFDMYLKDDKNLKKLAETDAKGIARYYHLKNKNTGKTYEELENRQEKIVHIVDGKAENNKISRV